MAIFISYSRSDEVAVKSLAAGLDGARKEIWYDFDIQGGEPWWDRILESIRTATLFLFALSDESLKSKPCMAEVNYAIALDRPVLPVVVGPVDPSHGPLGGYKAIAYDPDDAPQAFRLFAAIEELTDQARPLPDPLPHPPPIPYGYLLAIGRKIETMTLTYDEQLALVDELKRHYKHESDDNVRGKIIAMLENLKSKGYVAMEVVNEITTLLRDLATTRRVPPPIDTQHGAPAWWKDGTNAHHLHPTAAAAPGSDPPIQLPPAVVTPRPSSVNDEYFVQQLQPGVDGVPSTPNVSAVNRPGPSMPSTQTPGPDGDVELTVFRSAFVRPGRWHALVTFAYLSGIVVMPDGRRADARTLLGDMADEVFAREASPPAGVSGGSQPIENDDLLLEPWLDSGEVDPPRRWVRQPQPLQQADFRIRLPADSDGTTTTGGLRVYRGILLIGEVRFAVDADASRMFDPPRIREQVRRYRRVFASYSEQDTDIARQISEIAQLTGDEWMVQTQALRAGENWQADIRDRIEQADAFQLFWSAHSMASAFGRREWQHALSLGRDDFVRPVYWDAQLPENSARDLPPTVLKDCRFSRLPVRAPAATSASAALPKDTAVNDDGQVVASSPATPVARLKTMHEVVLALVVALLSAAIAFLVVDNYAANGRTAAITVAVITAGAVYVASFALLRRLTM